MKQEKDMKTHRAETPIDPEKLERLLIEKAGSLDEVSRKTGINIKTIQYMFRYKTIGKTIQKYLELAYDIKYEDYKPTEKQPQYDDEMLRTVIDQELMKMWTDIFAPGLHTFIRNELQQMGESIKNTIKNELSDRPATENGSAFPIMLGITDAASKTGLSYRYLRSLCHSGAIKFKKSGKKYLINMDDLATYMNSNNVKGEN